MPKMATRKRQANDNDVLTDKNTRYQASNENIKSRDKKQINAFLIWPTVFIFYTLAILFLNKVKYHKYPDPKYSRDSVVKDQFFEDEARKHLLELCSLGPKPVGSFENEVNAIKYIKDQINAIKSLKTSPSPMNAITLDIQKVSGAFLLKNFVRTSYYTVYENLQNVVVMLEPPNSSNSSLLINCHYDTVIDSPGAGDNTASCAVMLELLRALYISREPLKHNIIFLFNGAEENILQASHGFITQHPWASSIKTFINLDSAGAGGWEIVFQTGPEHPWLVKAYAESAPYPFGSILGQELFQSGVVPSDTDFRIFRDFGNLPGLDIAYIANGYVYHTQNDRPEYIPSGCIQRAGDNLLSVIKHLCSNDKLEDPGADKHGTMVFFDVVGLFMVHYPSRIGAIFNFSLVFIVFVTLLLKYKIRIVTNQKVSTDKTLWQAILFSILSMVLVFAILAVLAVLVDLVGQPMFWFTRTYNILLVYGVMSFTILLGFHYWLKQTTYKYTPDWYTESLYYDATIVLFSILTLVLTYNDFASAFLPMMWILGPFTSRYIITYILKIDNTQGPTVSFILVTLSGQLIPVIATLHNLESMFVLFIPIMGRVGGNAFPDVLIAMMTAVAVVICMQYLVGIVYLCSKLKPLIVTLVVLLTSSLLLTQFTAFGFPYSGNKESPTPQRAMYFHLNRNFYNHDSSINKSDSGIWYLPLDHNSASFIKDNPVIHDSHLMLCQGNYCGVPYLYPVIHVVDARTSLYTTKPPPVIKNPLTVKLVEKEVVKFSPRIVRITLDVTGPDHITMFVTPIHGAEMTRWSITDDSEHFPTKLPSGINDTTYFIYYSYGLKPDQPYRFFVDIKAPNGHREDKHLVDIAFSGHFISGTAKTSPELVSFKESLPDWIVSLSWICSYDSFLF